MNDIEELKKAALGVNLHGWTGFEDALNADGYSEAVSKFIGHCRPSEILALIAQLEAAQLELIKPLPIGELVQRLEGQTYEKWFSESDVKGLCDRAETAEAALSAANEKLKGEQVPVDTGIFTRDELAVVCKARVRDMPGNYADHQIAKVALRSLYTAPQNPVVLLDKYVRNEKGQYILDGKCEPRIGFAVGWNAAIKAAGFTVEGE